MSAVFEPEEFEVLLDGLAVPVRAGETLLTVAQREGVEIPHLCFKPGLRPDGNCRACMVEIDGERALAPSCCRTAAPGMKVHSASPRAAKSRQMVLEMLLADLPEAGYKCLGLFDTRPRVSTLQRSPRS